MKKLLIVLFLFTGCAWVGKQVDYAKLCQQDEACLPDAKSKASLVTTIISAWNPIAGGVAGAGSLAMFLWIGGLMKKKKESAE